ncbi:MAG: PEPxxWA-CTERM sorting domain-containing protein [Alphaproteobacteria bacterium]|nr:PEPxxWA-CTERM sorting domain-containing protein [Alphaproteobacteria bacterium]MBU1514682.1 PEPxxWA-CTERM sorting domain-containing protein [Alphaproteobacteria bacterium]MBU2093541.1 PEPxxWA-CTERM sorting domain-containing protein [Alphaproteobacteria bacterium]MBU2149455.1 PEPxxWA-CTERM sorting domain-containing protein [Alphaproteobacteria bacterium]MBU2305502.1 PEPxxWA-CTERM sorting domain-containing protein [Alphaproteobacteria bacterium]
MHYSAVVNVADAQNNVPTSFTFSATGFPAVDVLVDRVYIAAVPEPMTWTLMIMGFGGAGAALRRQRRRLAAI